MALNDNKKVQIVNTFISNIASDLKIAESANCNAIPEDPFKDPFIKSIVKYRNHTSMLNMAEVCNRQQESLFPFSDANTEQMLKKNCKFRLDKNKSTY